MLSRFSALFRGELNDRLVHEKRRVERHVACGMDGRARAFAFYLTCCVQAMADGKIISVIADCKTIRPFCILRKSFSLVLLFVAENPISNQHVG